MSPESVYRVAVLTTHPIPYFVGVYRALAAHPEIDLTVLFETDLGLDSYFEIEFGTVLPAESGLLDGYRHVFLSRGERKDSHWSFWSMRKWNVVPTLWRGQYDALFLHGYRHLTNWLALLAAKSHGATVLLREPPTLLDPRNRRRQVAKRLILGVLFRVVYGMYVGTLNRAYLQHYGMPEARLFPFPNTVDNAYFRRRALELAPQKRQLRRRFGLPEEQPVILYCGNLTPNKQPLMLLAAFRQLRGEAPCSLLYAGDGVERRCIERECAESQLADVRITGPLTQDQVCEAYAAADILVLPSQREVWGLVVNEAMNFGLPVVVSENAGCVPDLVHPGENGFVVPSGDVDSLHAALRQLVVDADLRRRYGARSAEIIARWGVEGCVDGVLSACRTGVGARRAAQPVAGTR